MRKNSIILLFALVAISCKKKSETKALERAPFVTKWNVFANQTIVINKSIDMNDPLGYDFYIDWGDGSEVESFDDTQRDYEHTYTIPKEYHVTITGTFPGFSFNSQDAFITVVAWGDNKWKSMGDMFYNCTSFETIEAKDQPDLSQCTYMAGMFAKAKSFNWDISGWSTENVTNMAGMFAEATAFNGDISGWNTENVTDMAYMFNKAKNFDQDISQWNTNKVTSFYDFAKTSKLTCTDIPAKLKGSGCKL